MGFMSDIAGGAIAAAGSVISTGMSNKNANAMSNSAVSRRTADLKNAGLNPILAATNGGLQAAQTPPQQTPNYSPIANLYSAKSQRIQAESGRKSTDSAIILQNAQTAKTLADTKVSLGQVGVQDAQRNLVNQQALTQQAVRANYAAQTGLASANAVRANYQAVQDRANADFFNTQAGSDSVKVNEMYKRGPFTGAVQAFKDAFSTPAVAPHSAKKVIPANKYQKELRFQYGGR